MTNLATLLGYVVVEQLGDGPVRDGVEPYFFYNRTAADTYAAEISEADGPRYVVVEAHGAGEATS